MRRPFALIALLVGVLSCAVPARAQNASAHETTVLTAGVAVQLQAATTAQAAYCVVAVENGPIRYWTDNSQPTVSSGIYISPGTQFPLISVPAVASFWVIAAGPSATLQTQCYRTTMPGPTTITPTVGSSAAAAPNAPATGTVETIGGIDASGVTRAVTLDSAGQPLKPQRLLLPCNALRTTNCQ